jgi:predicted TPR repeat methyltransferase
MNKDISDFDEEAKALLARAYALKDSAQSKELYSQWAQTYDRTMLQGLGYLTPKNTAILLAKNVSDKKSRILDVGSGTGLAGVELSLLGFKNLDALDYSPEMLAVAAHRNVYKSMTEADLNLPLSFSDNSYDAMICTGTFTHAHVGAGCLDELIRLLKPKGYFAFTVHKDIWKAEGFEDKISSGVNKRVIEVVYKELGRYYAYSKEPEGYYLVLQKQG